MDADKIRPLWREVLKRAQGRADAAFLADVALLHEALMADGVEVTPEDVAIAEKTLQGLFTPNLHEGLEWAPVAMPNVTA